MANTYTLGEAPDKLQTSAATMRYAVVHLDDDNELRTVIEKKSNGQSFHMLYKTLSVAREAMFRAISEPESDYKDDDLAIYDRQYQTVL